MIIKQSMIDISINDSTANLSRNAKYRKTLKITGVPVITQKISCGYACIEMLSEYLETRSSAAPPWMPVTKPETIITEEKLLEANGGKITTSTNNGLHTEIQKQFPDYNITYHKNLKNSELIDKIYESLSNKMPVIFSYAALKEQTEDAEKGGGTAASPAWTLHYGVVVGMDIPGDKITVNNPYGYTEIYTVQDFLKATRFEKYENMEFFLKLGFAVEMFTKNTVYIFEKPE